jgi:1-deoxy-D-xylulose-5-phosphate synthase
LISHKCADLQYDLQMEDLYGRERVRGLDPAELAQLASSIRQLLIEKVSKSGGHLGPNLGVVELSIALHRVFDSPRDLLLFDTGHQSYVHKILTGRAADFDSLRQRGGIAGYPSRSESAHDVIENSHASTALSWGDGIARAFRVQGETQRTVVCIVGDGSLTGGMAWEALNNIAAAKELKLVIVVNDNGRSYSPTIGGLTTYLSTLRSSRGAGSTHGMFADLGLKYLGPVDGHDIPALESALAQAKNFGAPVIVHVITEKGKGHQPAINDEAEKFHAVGVVDPESGQPLNIAPISWTSIFAKEFLQVGRENPKVVAITAAMLGPTGLDKFQSEFPERTFDVGIAEQHAVTSAAGMAFAGLHPVIALYSTFLNRAFDQLLLDVALHKAGVTFVLDRSGVTGDDGPSHNGIWDLALTGIVPTLSVAAPRDSIRLRELLREAIAISDAPSLLRFPKGGVVEEVAEIERIDGIDILYRTAQSHTLLVSIGAFANLAVAAAAQATLAGAQVTVVDPRWVKPLPASLLEMARNFSAIVVVEDGIKHGGIASSFSEQLREAQIATPLHSIGVPLEFFDHSKRNEVLSDFGITVPEIAKLLIALSSQISECAVSTYASDATPGA